MSEPPSILTYKEQLTYTRMHGVAGPTVSKLRKFHLGLMAKISPEIVILEIGTNDLVNTPPEVVGSYIEDMVSRVGSIPE